MQCLDALQYLESICRRDAGAEVTQPLRACAHDKGSRTEFFTEDDAVIARIGRGQRRKFSGFIPIEMTAIDNDSSDGDAVAADPFGDGVHHDVGTEFDRAREIGRRKRIVDQQRYARFMRDLSHCRNVENLKARIADGFADHKLSLGADGGTDAVEIARFDEGRRDAEARQRVCQKIDGPTVKRSGRDYVIAGIEQCRDCKM